MSKTVQYITDVPENDLCHSCGGCSGICATDAITMEWSPKGILAPVVDPNSCTNCGMCLSVCPGHEMNFPYFHEKIFGRAPERPEIGNYLGIYGGYASEGEVQYKGQSGGVVSALLIYMLNKDMIDGAIVTRAKKDEPTRTETYIARTRAEVLESVGSKYGPVPAAEAIKFVQRERGRFVFVGVSCQVHAFRKAAELNKRVRNSIVAYFGLHCKGVYNLHFFEYLMDRYGVSPAELKDFNLRSKEWRGWPCDLRMEKADGEVVNVRQGPSRVAPRAYFTPWRCLTCTDKLNEFSDISFGDARAPRMYGKGKLSEAEFNHTPGQSDMVGRTEFGQKLLLQAESDGVLTMQSMTADELIFSTKPGDKKLGVKNLKYVAALFGLAMPRYGFDCEIKSPRKRMIFHLMQAWSMISSLQYYYFHAWLSRSPRLRKLLVRIPERWMRYAAAIRRRMTNYAHFSMEPLEATYGEPVKVTVKQGSCIPESLRLAARAQTNAAPPAPVEPIRSRP